MPSLSLYVRYDRKLDPKLAETTWVHKLFGGKLRSRVTCQSCGHNSDTFDNILDLSIDIFGASSVQQALKKFVAIDSLKGADKYKCDAYVYMLSVTRLQSFRKLTKFAASSCPRSVLICDGCPV